MPICQPDMSTLLMCPQLIISSKRKIMSLECTHLSDYTFVQLSDPQLGLLEKYIEKRDPPIKWDREIALVNRAVNIINELSLKPKFVIVCGDLVHARPENPDQIKQYSDLMAAFSLLHEDIPLLVLPGNHDIGNEPTVSSLKGYNSIFGDDYYSYWCGSIKYIVVNSQLFWNSSNCLKEAADQDEWLTNELTTSKTQSPTHLIIFQHIPFFCKDVNEADGYYNYPKTNRFSLLQRYYDAGVRFVFSGHLHFNGGGFWYPDGCSLSPMHLVSSSAVGIQMGDDSSGLRIIRVSSSSNTVIHKYFSFEDLEQTPSLASSL